MRVGPHTFARSCCPEAAELEWFVYPEAAMTPICSPQPASTVLVCAVLLTLVGCDPHIVRNPGDFKEDRQFISPPTLRYPIYACGRALSS